MEDVTRKRIMRMLEGLPEEQLYQVLDYIEFVETKYARAASRKPDPFQRFAERVEDQMRVRSVAPKAMKGAMRLMSTAGRMVDGVRELGRDLTGGSEAGSSSSRGSTRGATPRGSGVRSGERTGTVGEAKESDGGGGREAAS